jgi:hypothetical protein
MALDNNVTTIPPSIDIQRGIPAPRDHKRFRQIRELSVLYKSGSINQSDYVAHRRNRLNEFQDFIGVGADPLNESPGNDNIKEIPQSESKIDSVSMHIRPEIQSFFSKLVGTAPKTRSYTPQKPTRIIESLPLEISLYIDENEEDRERSSDMNIHVNMEFMSVFSGYIISLGRLGVFMLCMVL